MPLHSYVQIGGGSAIVLTKGRLIVFPGRITIFRPPGAENDRDGGDNWGVVRKGGAVGAAKGSIVARSLGRFRKSRVGPGWLGLAAPAAGKKRPQGVGGLLGLRGLGQKTHFALG